MKLTRHDGLEKDFRDLRRFPAAEASLAAWERLFCLKGVRETPGVEMYPGFGNAKIYKGRVVPLRENIGKSKGYRVIFQMVDESCCEILVFSRHGIYKSEQDLIRLIKVRLGL